MVVKKNVLESYLSLKTLILHIVPCVKYKNNFLLIFAAQGNVWPSSWQGGTNDGNQQQSAAQQHQAGNHQEQPYGGMFNMLDPPAQEFGDFTGMFQNFTE